MAGLEGPEGIKFENLKTQLDRFMSPDGHDVIALALGRLLDLGGATGHQSFVRPYSSTSHVLAQLDLLNGWEYTKAYKNNVNLLSENPDERGLLRRLTVPCQRMANATSSLSII